MGYTPSNNGLKRINGILVVADGTNDKVDRAFDCADEYLQRISHMKWAPSNLWFRKYTNEPGIMCWTHHPPPVLALQEYVGELRLIANDTVFPKIYSVDVNDIHAATGGMEKYASILRQSRGAPALVVRCGSVGMSLGYRVYCGLETQQGYLCKTKCKTNFERLANKHDNRTTYASY